MITVIASINVKPEHKVEFIHIFKENVPFVLKRKGVYRILPDN